MIPPLDIHATPEKPDLEKVQGNVKRFATALENCPIIDGRLLTGLYFSGTGTKKIEHGLGRIPRGVIITRRTNAASFYWVAWDALYIDVAFSWGGAGFGTYDLWVF